MGVYADVGTVATGPMRPVSAYGSAKDMVRWAMMRADSASPYAHPDQRDAWVMDAAVRRSHTNKTVRGGKRAKRKVT